MDPTEKRAVSNGVLPIQNAARSGHVEVVRYLLDITPNLASDSTTALWNAVLNNWFETAEVAIEKGANIHSKDRDETLLDSARSQKMINMLQNAQSNEK